MLQHKTFFSFREGITDHSGLRLHMTPTLRQYDVGLLEFGVALSESMMLPPHFESLIYRGHGMPSCFGQVRLWVPYVFTEIAML